MERPLDLQEILSDARAEAVRLPRHRAGGSPQGMIVTLLADYGLRHRAWLPSAALVALIGDFGVTPGGARTAISRLARRGVLESRRQGRNTSYRLTHAAADALAGGGAEIASFPRRAEAWDGQWTLVAFSLPQQQDSQRRALRSRLRWLGYAPLYDALWVSPNHPAPEAAAALAATGAGEVNVFRARRVELGGPPDRDPLSAWDLPEVARRYAAFLERWCPLLPRIGAGDVGGAEALRARTAVMDSYRRFVALDPWLPMELMPDGWPRVRAREVFAAVYDGLAGPALGHVRAGVARFTDARSVEAAPAVTTHTLEDLLAGLHPAPESTGPPDDAGPPEGAGVAGRRGS